MKKADINEKFVLEVNKKLHDEVARTYVGTPSFFKPTAIKKWNEVASDFLSHSHLNILDFGSGTGFVPEIIIPHLQHSTLFCMDVSRNSLRYSQKLLKNEYNSIMKIKKIKIKFIANSPSAPLKIPLPSHSMDVVLTNFVLHHLYNPETFLDEARRVLKNNGLLIIGFEPNELFFKSKTLHFFNTLSQYLIFPVKPAILIKSICGMPFFYRLKSFIRKKFLNKKYFKINELEDSLNKYFLNKNLIKAPLTFDDFMNISNYQSAIDSSILTRSKHFIPVMFETYVYLPFLSAEIPDGKFKNTINHVEVFLKKKFTNYGCFFFFILKKRC